MNSTFINKNDERFMFTYVSYSPFHFNSVETIKLRGFFTESCQETGGIILCNSPVVEDVIRPVQGI